MPDGFDYRKLIGIPLAQLSLLFANFILSALKLLTPIQTTALFLFFLVPLILEFLLWLADRGTLSKMLHVPVFSFLLTYMLFIIANIYMKNIMTWGAMLTTFVDFLVALFISVSSTLIVRFLFNRMFIVENGRIMQERDKKLKVLVIMLAAVLIPVLLIIIFNLFTGTVVEAAE